ncbi:dehydrogenase [Natronococcus amylolyticus DSM 10524]|uniref:Dehydrogenase n=1 Tax=Natronococcus amylolyticus DSM 10524 TaxID=1227497 RepID=L9X1N1_9EURY|nr:Gfo/Idh/MocA family oxidoreductase [Natronococcus amylolyticus]ELY55381.1 dehydrogenase [Natronococcus amylolyticus DSM 10524]
MSVRVGLLSAAHVHADAYVAALRELEDAAIVGVADPDAERGRETAAHHDLEYVANADDLFERIDAGVICAPNAAHREWIERATDAGVDVLCEKPLAPTLEDPRAIVETWRDADVAVGVAMPLRFSEPARRARRALEAGDLGSLWAISGTNRGHIPGGWFVDPELAGGGAVMDHTVHLVDLVASLTGERVAEVYAEVDTRFHDGAVDDVNVLSMELTDGTGFLLDGSWSKPDAWHTWGDATLEFVGTDGTLAIDCTGESITHTVASGEEAGVHTVSYGDDPTAKLVADFVAAVREGRAPLVTPDDGLEAVTVVEAAYESAASAQPVTVETQSGANDPSDG